jgi:hypothetical protein
VPVGGTTGQVLSKASGTNYDTTWTTVSGGGGAPDPHASTHAAAGTDPVTLAQSQITGLTSDLAAKVPTSRNVSTGTGLSGGGDLSADRTLSVTYGTAAGTAAQGDDSRIVGAAQKASNLSDLASAATARTNLGLAAIASTGSADDLTAGTVPTARLGTGTASATTALRGNQTYASVPSGNASANAVSTGAYFTGSGLYVGTTTGNLAMAPDSAALDVTGDIEIVARLAPPNWVPASAQWIASKLVGSGNQRSWRFGLGTAGVNFTWSADGTASTSAISTATPSFSADQAGWVKVTFDVDNGAGGKTATFYTAPDSTSEPSTWTQLGSPVTTAGTTSIYSSTAPLAIGSAEGTSASGGQAATYERLIVRNGIGGTTVFDANLEAVAAHTLAFTESSTNAATVTLTTTRYSYGLPGVAWSNIGTQALTANTVYYALFEVTAPIVVDAVVAEVTTGPVSVSSDLRLGVYAADGNQQPTGAPLIDSGAITVAAATTGIFTKQTAATTLTPGMYLTAVNASVAMTLRRYNGGPGSATTSLGATPFVALMSATQTNGAYPTPGTTWATRATANNAPFHEALLRWRPAT